MYINKSSVAFKNYKILNMNEKIFVVVKLNFDNKHIARSLLQSQRFKNAK